MAIEIATEYIEAIAPSGAYPGGSFKNVSSPSATDGTPFELAWPNDWLGFFSRLLLEASITPSGVPDTVLASDYYDALVFIMNRQAAAESIRSFDLVADMVADTDLNVGDLVTTRGYLAQGVGSAIYRVVAAATGTPDGGEFINLATHQAQLLQLPGQPITASQYGAVGDGITDDSTALNNLLSAFSNVVIDTNSAVTTTLIIGADTIVTISNVLEFANTATTGITMGARSRLYFVGIGELQGDGASIQKGITASSVGFVEIHNLRMTAFRLVGIEFINVNQCLIMGGSITGNDQVAGAGVRFAGVSSPGMNRIVNINCSSNANGIMLFDIAYTIISNVVCDSNSRVGIVLNTTATENRILNVRCNNNGTAGISINADSENIHVDNAICASNPAGIIVNSSTGIKITNSLIDTNTADGIAIIGTGSENVQIAECTIVNNGGYGISGTGTNVVDLIILASYFDNNTTADVQHTKAGNLCTGFITENDLSFGGVSIKDGASIPHGVTDANQVLVTSNQPTWMISVTAIAATTFTIGVYDITTGLAVTVGQGGTELYYRVTR